MRKLKFYIAAAVLASCFGLGSAIPALQAEGAEDRYYIGGMTAGFMLNAGGAQVIGLSEIVGEDGAAYRPAEEAGIRAGDTICAADGIAISNIEQLNAALERSGGKSVRLLVKRNGDNAEITIQPVKEKKSGKYKLGVLIRDTVSGIGTVTYIHQRTMRFGALGHAVTDESKQSMTISDAKVYLCSVIGVNKGIRGKAGELRGLFLNDKTIAKAEKVCSCGLYGTFEGQTYDLSKTQTVPAAPISEATIGKAVIYSTVDGVSPQMYEIAIAKVDEGNKENKNFVIKITDEKLIEETGGIVQGMSGSPIIQNGKLIGAVTHVFLNDPTRGYGIGIEKMISSQE